METDFDALYEFHAVAQTMEDEFSKSSELQRLYTRRRSISLTSEVDPEMLAAVVARVRQKHERGRIEIDVTDEGDETDDDVVRRKRNVPKRNTSDPKRPSSMLVHENDELLQLADELHLRDLHQSRNQDWKEAVKSGRRSSSSAGYLLYHGVSDDNPLELEQILAPVQSKLRSGSQKDASDALRRASVCSNRFHTTDGNNSVTQSSLKSSPNSGSKSSKLTSLGHLFGSGGKNRSGSSTNPPVVANVGGVQGKIVKKMERQLSKESGNNVGDNRRAQFLQARANTGLNFFGGRRRSIAITDDAYGVALRAAKSHLDLSGAHLEQQDQQQQQHQPEIQQSEEIKKNGETIFKSNVQRKLFTNKIAKNEILFRTYNKFSY